VNSLAETSYSNTTQNNRGIRSRSKRILFVAPSTCGQLQIARYFWEFYRPDGYNASFATLENNAINPWLDGVMRDYEVIVKQNQVDSIFVLASAHNDYDCIVSLGGFQNYSTISPFMETLNILFGKTPKRVCWDIPDPQNCKGSREDARKYAEDIRSRIEFEIAQLAQSLEEQE